MTRVFATLGVLVLLCAGPLAAQRTERGRIHCFTDAAAQQISPTPVPADEEFFSSLSVPSYEHETPRFPYEMKLYSMVARNLSLRQNSWDATAWIGTTVVMLVGWAPTGCEGEAMFVKERAAGFEQYHDLRDAIGGGSGIPRGKVVRVVGAGLFLGDAPAIVPFEVELIDDPGAPDDGSDGGSGGEVPEIVPPPNVSIEPSSLHKLRAFGGEESSQAMQVLTNNGWRGEVMISHMGLDPGGIAIDFSPSVIPSPGDGVTVVTAQIPLGTYPMTHPFEIQIEARGEDGSVEYFHQLASIRVDCDTPFILDDDVSHPVSQSIRSDQMATLAVKLHRGSEPVRYQWYRGPRGFRYFPIAGAVGSELQVSPLEPTQYWVEVTNPCGSALSRAATVTPEPGDGVSRSRGRRARPVAPPQAGPSN